MNQKFPRTERLRSGKMIGRLFDRRSKENISLLAYPLRAIVWQEEHTGECYPEVLVSVPKRSFRRAVERNRIRRLVREAYRKQKRMYGSKTYIVFLVVGKEVSSLQQIERGVAALLEKIK